MYVWAYDSLMNRGFTAVAEARNRTMCLTSNFGVFSLPDENIFPSIIRQ